MEFSRLLRKPRKQNGAAFFRRGWDGRTRTCECQSQSLVPYRLATSHYLARAGGATGRGTRPLRGKTAAFPLGDIPGLFRQAGFNPSSCCCAFPGLWHRGRRLLYGVSDGTRTHGLQSHNLTR